MHVDTGGYGYLQVDKSRYKKILVDTIRKKVDTNRY